MVRFCNRNVKWRTGSENTGQNVVLDSRYCNGASSTGNLLMIFSTSEPVPLRTLRMVIEMSGYASVGEWVGFNFLLITFVK